MPSAEVQLNGSGNYILLLEVNAASQNAAGNYTTFSVNIWLLNPNASPSWSGSPQYWSVNFGGQVYSGSFTIPSSGSTSTKRLLDSRYMNIGHDSEGYRVGFATVATVDTNHSTIGDGSVVVYADATRIGKRPTPPRSVVLSDATDTGFTASWVEPADWRGSYSGGGRYVVRRRQGSPTSPSYADYSVPVQQTSVRIEALTAGTEQFVEVMAQGGASYDNGGYSDMSSPMASIILQAGIFVSDGEKWVASSFRVSNGTDWPALMPKISDGDSWEDPIDV